MPRAAAVSAAARRAHAVEALLLLARETAPDQITTAAIAARMGVSQAALFRHFPSREAIWTEAVSWATGELERRFEALGAGPPLQQVAALLACHAAMLQQHPGLVRMLFAELQRPATSPARETGKAFMQRFRHRLAAGLRGAQAAQQLDPRLAPDELAALLVASQQGLILQALVHDGFADLVERSRHSASLLLSAFQQLPPPDDRAAAPTA